MAPLQSERVVLGIIAEHRVLQNAFPALPALSSELIIQSFDLHSAFAKL